MLLLNVVALWLNCKRLSSFISIITCYLYQKEFNHSLYIFIHNESGVNVPSSWIGWQMKNGWCRCQWMIFPDCSVLSVVFSALTLLIGLWEWHKNLVPFLQKVSYCSLHLAESGKASVLSVHQSFCPVLCILEVIYLSARPITACSVHSNRFTRWQLWRSKW